MAWTGETTDEDLFAAYRGGDQGAFELLFRRYQGPLGRHLERMMDDRAAAEDLVVETFQRLHIHRDRFRAGAVIPPGCTPSRATSRATGTAVRGSHAGLRSTSSTRHGRRRTPGPPARKRTSGS